MKKVCTVDAENVYKSNTNTILSDVYSVHTNVKSFFSFSATETPS